MTIIGNSGFKYTCHTRRDPNREDNILRTLSVKNINTEKEIFNPTLRYWVDNPRKNESISKTFLGMDNIYYHIIVTRNNITWGEVTPDGAVIDASRTIIKHINFYPQYQQPQIEPEIKVSNIPPIDITPKVITLSPKQPIIPNTPPVEEISWLNKLINQIKQWIKKILTL